MGGESVVGLDDCAGREAGIQVAIRVARRGRQDTGKLLDMVTVLAGVHEQHCDDKSVWQVSRLQDVASKHKERQVELDSFDMPKVSVECRSRPGHGHGQDKTGPRCGERLRWRGKCFRRPAPSCLASLCSRSSLHLQPPRTTPSAAAWRRFVYACAATRARASRV
jgi:hypothetical protein